MRRKRLTALSASAAVTLSLLAATASPVSAAESECPNEQFRNGRSAALPDCRAFEQVSPTEKNGYGVNAYLPAWATPDGEALSYMSLVGAFASARASTFPNAYLASRGSDRWQTTSVSPPAPEATPPGGDAVGYDFSSDLSRWVVRVPEQALAPGATPGAFNLFLTDGSATYSLINNLRPAHVPPEECFGFLLAYCYQFNDLVAFAGASASFDRVLYEFRESLFFTEVEQLYESHEGQVEPVGVLPDGAPASSSTAGAGTSSMYSTIEPHVDRRVAGAISADGSRIVFTAPSDEGEPSEAGQKEMAELYDRIGGTETIELSAPAPGATPVNPAAQPATYWAASADGSRVFFTSSAELTTSSNTGPANEGSDLYEYDLSDHKLTDLTVDSADATGAGVLGVVGASADGSYVYFAATGQLVAGKGEAGKPNLYLVHRGGAPAFIATLSERDEGNWTQDTAELEAYLTPDGRHLVFSTVNSPPTANFPGGYDNINESSGEPEREVYEYSAVSGELLCASCDPSGARPIGPAVIGGHAFPGSFKTSINTPFHQVRVASDDGSRVFFTSRDPLAAGASSVTTQVKLYEYEEDGDGSCQQTAGCIYLLSGAAGSGEATFLGADRSGGNVFFTTFSRLTASDQDGQRDVYDARVGGGLAEPASLPSCEGEACHGPDASTPALPSGGANSFQGPGNPHPRRRRHRHHHRRHHHLLADQQPAPGKGSRLYAITRRHDAPRSGAPPRDCGAGLRCPASAAPPAPRWQILVQPAPTFFHAGDTTDFYEVIAVNDGGAPTTGKVTVKDTLPEGLLVTATSAAAMTESFVRESRSEMECTISGGSAKTVECGTEESVPIGARVLVKINVEVPSGAAAPLRNIATIAGGGAANEVSTTNSTPVVAPSTPVPYGVSFATEATEEDGALATRAGSHPFSFSTIVAMNVASVNTEEECGPEIRTPGCGQLVNPAKDIHVELPPGFIGNPLNVPRCSQEQFQFPANAGCPPSTQVGDVWLAFYGSGTAEQYAPVYNIEPPPGQPAEFGFTVGGGANIPMFFHLRADGDYGLTTDLGAISTFDAARIAELTIWGVPAEPAHDQKRESILTGCTIGESSQLGCSAAVLPTPLLAMPTSCAGEPLGIPLLTDSWSQPGDFVSGEPEASIEPMSHCDSLEFAPTLQARPTTNVADSPSGLHVDLNVPQPESVEGLAEANLRDAVVTLPKGISVNPSSANGLEGCSPAQIELHASAPANCPNASKIGKVEVDTPLLDHPLPGAVYLATPYQNPFGSLIAIYIAVFDPKTNVVIKLAGEVKIGEGGQLTTTFAENPQLPFEDFKLDFFSGAKAPLRTPPTCGTYQTTSALTPWSAPESGPPATPSDTYQITQGPGGSGCVSSEGEEPNKPAFESSTETPIAGAYSPFYLHLHREDGSQEFKALNVTLPPGLLGKLAGAAECPTSAIEAAAAKSGAEEQAAPSCPAASELGTVNVAAGAGPSPFWVQGTAYLAGPYRGAPLSLAIITPALAGPYDLGTVVVRSALYVSPQTTQITVKSDPIPTALKGIALDVRTIAVEMKRPDFTLNPTSCDPMVVDGEELSVLGQSASLSNRFQVGGCRALGFAPKLKISLKGKTTRAQHPALKAVLTMKPGEANIAKAQVTLPHSEFLDQGHIGTVCTRVQFAEGNVPGEKCPPASIYGFARAITPLLDHPVEGPVYLRSSSHKLPDLVAALNGQISVALDGTIDSVHGGIRNRFEVVPDAPVSRFTLEMQGGRKGLLVNSTDICAKPNLATADFTAQNGKVDDTTPVLQSSCKKSGHKKKHGKGRKHHRAG